MKIAQKCLSIFLCVVLLVSCSGKGPDACVREIKEILSADFSESEYLVGFNRDTNTLIVKLLQSGLEDELEAAKGGDSAVLESWTSVIENTKTMCLSFVGKLKEHNMDADCVLYVCDSANQDKALLSVRNGLVEYDILAGITGTVWKKQFTLDSGNYTAGVDFGPGAYDIEAVSGYGNVYDNQLLGLNLVMATKSEDTFGIAEQTFKNAYFADGTILTISGVKIRMKLVEEEN